MKLCLVFYNSESTPGRVCLSIDGPVQADGNNLVTDRGSFAFGGMPCVPGGSLELTSWEKLKDPTTQQAVGRGDRA